MTLHCASIGGCLRLRTPKSVPKPDARRVFSISEDTRCRQHLTFCYLWNACDGKGSPQTGGREFLVGGC